MSKASTITIHATNNPQDRLLGNPNYFEIHPTILSLVPSIHEISAQLTVLAHCRWITLRQAAGSNSLLLRYIEIERLRKAVRHGKQEPFSASVLSYMLALEQVIRLAALSIAIFQPWPTLRGLLQLTSLSRLSCRTPDRDHLRPMVH